MKWAGVVYIRPKNRFALPSQNTPPSYSNSPTISNCFFPPRSLPIFHLFLIIYPTKLISVSSAPRITLSSNRIRQITYGVKNPLGYPRTVCIKRAKEIRYFCHLLTCLPETGLHYLASVFKSREKMTSLGLHPKINLYMDFQYLTLCHICS